jgi:hypothetical protein
MKGDLKVLTNAKTPETERQTDRIKVLQEAIEAIAQHPTLDRKAKHRGIKPLKLALDRLVGQSS